MEKKPKTTAKKATKAASADSVKRPKGGLKEKSKVRAGAMFKYK